MEQQKGFTILEVIIAAFILMVGIGGAFALIQQNISITSISKNQLIATNLVNEGLESVRAIRDSNFIAIFKSVPLVSWDSNGIEDCDSSGTNISLCQFVCVEETTSSFPSCNTNMPDPGFVDFKLEAYQGNVLQIDSNADFRIRTSGSLTPSLFTREIRIEKFGVNKVEVKVRVFWTQKGVQRTVEATTFLYNWL